MNKLLGVFYITLISFLPFNSTAQIATIFDRFPWLTEIVQIDDCTQEKIEVYQTGIFTYLLVTDADGISILYNEYGQFYCQIQTNFDCVSIYNLKGPIENWTCEATNPEDCLITITNKECRRVGIYDEQDNLLTVMDAGPHPFGPLGQPSSIWQDSRPLADREERTYIFKENNLVLGRRTVSCANLEIEVVSNYFSGCTDAIGLLRVTNTGCRTILIHNTRSEVLESHGPGTQFIVEDGPQIFLLIAGKDTLVITGSRQTGYEADSGGCNDSINPIFLDYPWLNTLFNPNECIGEEVSVYPSGIFSYLLVKDARGNTVLYNEDGQFYCQQQSNYDCVAAYNLGSSIASWTCGNPPINIACDLLNNLPDDSTLCASCYKTIDLYEFGGEAYLVYTGESNNCNNLDIQVINCNTNIAYCVQGHEVPFEGNCPYFFAEGKLIETVWEANCEEETSGEALIFEEFPWLNKAINLSNCTGTIISVYEQGIFSYIFIETGSSGELYFQDGTFYCQNINGYDCVAAYNLGEPVAIWTCDGLNFPQTEVQEGENISTINFEVFPNPVNHQMTVQLPPSIANLRGLQLANVYGQIVQEQKIEGAAKNLRIDVSNLNNGVYYVILHGEDKMFSKKIIKQ